MYDKSQANKRIAKNTLVIYGQLMLRMFLGLFTSRLALEALGVSDFGLNSVVGGVVVLFTFLSESLSGTTIRFINVERGKPDGNLNRVFNVCNVLHIAMAIFLFILLEVGGGYYIHHYLNFDLGKGADAMFVFQVSTVMCCLGVINVPFASMFNATEKFLFTATVAISVKVVQLILLFWLLTYEGNRLRAFALIETLTTLTSFIVYHYYAYHRWPDVVKWNFVKIWHFYKELLSYSFYNLMSTIAYMGRAQGSTIIINYFFGTLVNGAFAVAKNVERNIFPFASNFKNAAIPQIMQSYSSGDMERVLYLTCCISKYCMLMMMLAFFPLWAELDFVLNIWLIKVPEGAVSFCQLILLMVFVSVTDGCISSFVNATGKVGKFKTMYSFITLACIPIGIFVYQVGCPAYMILVVFLMADIFWRLVQLYMMNIIFHFPVRKFALQTYFPVAMACMPVVLCLIFTFRIQTDSFYWHICHIVLVFLLTALSAYYIGLHKQERGKVLNYIFQRIKHQNV